ncbi:bridge-like lipid transfer protein family member 1 [Lepeophtheirus salmonis]|uniref:bridge-like lipid transfer protein family member 1 n=1 Tax=Lepeophtheirus salmonis TaxID=72036 RepID=UPI001AE784B5|nr:transmembrane protein KIAA1109-like [Lepeophtheirus salmonis]
MMMEEGGFSGGGLSLIEEEEEVNNSTVNNILNEGKKILEERINLADIPDGPNFALFMCSLGFGIIWISYITFFNSRVVGSILTRLANKLMGCKPEEGYIKIGSLSWSVLSGKVMFREAIYMTPDYTLRIQDGFIIFRWWRSYVPKNVVEEDLSHSDTRLSLQLNGFEFHIYNRSSLYASLERIFKGLPPEPDQEEETEEWGMGDLILGKNWRDLIPVIKIDITSGKFAFGNKLIPSTLVISAEEMRSLYSTKRAGSPFDHFMHFLKCKAENLKVLLAPSPKYTGLRDEAPRFMGEGFVVLSSNHVDLYYYMDEAGIVPDGLYDENASLPEWGLDIKCGKATNFSYGPWADRQRELLYKFFFPPDYQSLKPTPSFKTGDRRTSPHFLIRLSTQYASTFDILFSKQKETNVMHINVEKGTNFDIKIPWTVKENGYSTKLNGTLLMVEATTSLPFRDLLECETLEFNVDMNYPMDWNAYQEWNFDFKPTKTSINFIFAHKWFFQDLIDDWSSKVSPDLMYFVPYTWKFNFIINHVELLIIANEFNWIDTSSTNQENCHLAVVGNRALIKFDLVYTDFLPSTVPFIFNIEGFDLNLALFLPETNTSHYILRSLDSNTKIVGRDGKVFWKNESNASKWRRKCKYEDGWIDCWSAPSIFLKIDFIFHPIPLPGPPPMADLPLSEIEEMLLSPLRAPLKHSYINPKARSLPENVDPAQFEADEVKVDIKVGPSTAFLYGTLIRNFMHLKENLFGTDQNFSPMEDFGHSQPIVTSEVVDEKEEDFDERLYRPLNVKLDVKVKDLQAHLIKHCSEASGDEDEGSTSACPYLVAEQLTFEMNKNYRETRLQLLLSPVILQSSLDDKDGFLVLTGLQFRGNAMFSELDRPIDSDTLEYAWLIEIQCGSLLGKISAPGLYDIFDSLESFIYLAVDKENVLKNPKPYKICQHDTSQKECPFSEDTPCSTEDELKYKMVRFSMDYIDINIIDKSSALRIQLCPLRFATCNLHGKQTKEGITTLVKKIHIQQFINSNFPLGRSDTDGKIHHPDIWVEAASFKCGPTFIEASTTGHATTPHKNLQEEQHTFLQKHDQLTKRLWFLWNPKLLTHNIESIQLRATKCGCVGGCNFFGSNINGPNMFKPSQADIKNRKNIAIVDIHPDLFDPAYGQSILHSGQCALEEIFYFKNLGETCLPKGWPEECHVPDKLPLCPDYRTQKSNSSNTSTDTPRHPKQHRSFSGKHSSKNESSTPRFLRSKKTINTINHDDSLQRSSSCLDYPSANTNKRSSYLERTESLVSDVLSFYSFEGGDSKAPSIAGTLSAPLSPRLSSYGSLSSDLNEERILSGSSQNCKVSSPTSTQYEFATGFTSPGSTTYQSVSEMISTTSENGFGTANMSPTSTIFQSLTSDIGGRQSSISYDTATLQPESSSRSRVGDDEGTWSRSLSQMSFVSALSEREDFGLVNLNMQLNKPITESPLLMTSYISHLTQLRCSNWTQGSTCTDLLQNDAWQPKFDLLEEGIGSMVMTDKTEAKYEGESIPSPADSNNFSWDDLNNPKGEKNEANEENENKDITNYLGDANTSKTTIVITFKSAIDVKLSPVILEYSQKIFESLNPVFQRLHPASVINRLHSSSLDRVESKNTLKKDQSLDLHEKLVENPSSGTCVRVFEKSISSYTQASINLPKIYVMILQASAVEEICAFSVLDNVRDITCVSLLTLGIKETNFQFCKASQSKKTVQMFIQKKGSLSNKKKKSKYKIKEDFRQNEPFSFESSETQKEELLLKGSLCKMHAQLRRLKNDSSILKDASITAIPNHRSKVFFEFSNVPKMSSGAILSASNEKDELNPPNEKEDEKIAQGQNTRLGFNMCECGFEGISIQVAKRSSNRDSNDTSSSIEDTSVEIEDEKSAEEEVKSVENEPSSPRGKRSTSSGCVELKTSWFNFAAPPKTPISRKIDFTKLDWNLLSTASPSINAWLSPLDRLQGIASNCINTYHQRVGAVMAALMAEALDVAAENFLKLTKYDKLTALSKTLRDDPSCQLCSILLRYILKTSLKEIESNLDCKGIPPLNILRQGIVVLSRQWKNALYTPILIEYNLRSKSLKNIYNTFDTNDKLETNDDDDDDDDDDEDGNEEENFDDDQTLLLKNNSHYNNFNPVRDNSVSSDFSAILRSKFSPLTSQNYNKIPVDELILLEKSFERNLELPKRDSLPNSDGTKDSGGGGSGEGVGSGDRSSPAKEEETLYNWMKRQTQGLNKSTNINGTNNNPKGSQRLVQSSVIDVDPEEEKMVIHLEEGLKSPSSRRRVSEIYNNNNQNDDENIHPNDEQAPIQKTKSMHLMDAHLIFEPLLSSLGLMPQQIQNLSLKNLGSNVSILASVDEFKIDIIESEFGKSYIRRKPQQLHFDKDRYSPAFLCEKIYLQIDFKKITDISMPTKVIPLYISRAQLKRQTSTIVNFSIDITTISQRVNMPLLRLLNQILTMHQNVKETSEELKERKPEEYMKHKKSSSGSSTSSNLSAHLRNSESYDASGFKSNQDCPTNSKKVNPGHTQSTPSPSLTLKSQLRNRPKTFAQKFRPNSRLAGYSNLESPVEDLQDSFVLTSGPLEKITEEQVTIRCWRTLYNLLELYSTMPTTKTVQRHSLTPNSSDTGILHRGSRRTLSSSFTNKEPKTPDLEMTTISSTPLLDPPPQSNTDAPTKKSKEVSFAKADVVAKNDHVPLVVFGIAKIKKTKLTATLSGLKLKGEITGLQSSVQYKEKIRTPMKGAVEASVVGNMTETNIVLIEGAPPNEQTVVKVKIGKSQVLHSSQMWKTKDKNSGTMSVALVQVDIPQHPVDLHSIVTRGTKELSSTLQEFKNVRILQRVKTVGEELIPPRPEDHRVPPITVKPKKNGESTLKSPVEDSNLIKPLVMQFNLILHKLAISAALLPSLMAEYSMEKVTSRGVTGSKAKFIIDLPKHTLSFNTKLHDIDNSEHGLPSEASIDLPPVHVKAEYIVDEPATNKSNPTPDDSVIRGGNYLSAEAEIGELEHCLTTDLLNHLVFVQKVFMKEVNEVVQKMSGADRPVPVWTEFGEEIEVHQQQRLLYSVIVRLKRITITATTPANSALRFETGISELHFSNRFEKDSNNGSNKLSTKANIHLKLSLGQIVRDSLYFEAEPQFVQQAYFKTTIQLRNAYQGENQDVIHITLNRPLVFIQPVAVDRAILVWLSYKNAWEYWTEQRLNLNKEVLVATEQVLEKVPISHITSQLGAQHVGTLFLQLDVRDIGLCLPLNDQNNKSKQDIWGHSALVLTIQSTSISACSAHAMVCEGNFKDLCIRFTKDFNHTLDDWKPDPSDVINLCLVSQGSYEVGSSTKVSKEDENAKWVLNIKWQMTGVDVHVDTNIGKHLSSLGHTLTSITGEEEEEEEEEANGHNTDSEEDGIISSNSEENIHKRHKVDIDLPAFLFNQNLSRSTRAKYLEQEINEQAKVVEDLQKLGACDSTVNSEIKKLNELQNIASKTFRQDLAQKLRRQKSKATYIKEKFGLGAAGSNHPRLSLASKSKSLCIPSPTREDFDLNSMSQFKRKKFGDSINVSLDEETASDLLEDSDLTLTNKSFLTLSSNDVFCPEKPSGGLSPRGSINNATSSTTNNTTIKSEPNIDFEFDVQIFINSGKCVLHAVKEEARKMKKDRSFSGNILDSPNPPVRKIKSTNEFKTVHSSARLMKMGYGTQQDITIFYIPGLDVKVLYMSKTQDDTTLLADSSLSSPNSTGRRQNSNKKGTLTAWMTLQSIPEETIITPSILEFLEQALEPIPTFSAPPKMESSRDEQQDNDVSSDDSGSQTGQHMVYTSFPVDVIVYFHIQSSTFRFSCLPVSRLECMLVLPSLDLVFSSKRVEENEFDKKTNELEAFGGLSVTGCLNDFNLYVFHPYGGRKKKTAEESQFSPLSSEERKDSLNVNVAFVKFHLSRSRKINYDKSDTDNYYSPPVTNNSKRTACVRFSTIVEIGSASFIYDMRRLTEILTFPKAWYRRTLVRRLFLGELKTTSFYPERESPCNVEAPKNSISTGSMGRKTSVKRNMNKDDSKKVMLVGKMSTHSWETLVVFAINFKELKVHMNMGNVMGNVDWLSKNFRSEGRLSIGSSGHKNMHISLGLNGSRLDAKGGIVGGSIDIGRVDTYCRLKEDSGIEPFHEMGVSSDVIEVKFDYMGTSVLMGRVSHLSVLGHDDWHVTDHVKDMPTMKPAQIFVKGDLSWDQFQLLLSKSTTADLIKIYNKLEEFFSQQFKSSRKLFSSLEPDSFSRRNGTSVNLEQNENKVSHHRHWQNGLSKISGLKISTLPFKLPDIGSVLGGVLELHGKHISLACFHGINFKSKSWALFSMKDPSISFVSDAQEVIEEEDAGEEGADKKSYKLINIIQAFSLSLGETDQPARTQHAYMATVKKISRNVNHLPPVKAVSDWFNYAFQSSDLDEVERFPTLSPSSDRERDKKGTQKIEEIFALPCLRMDLKTKHVQGKNEPAQKEETKPVVDCTFVTDFDNHIFVTTDAEAFFFLHDLITSYVKEKERVLQHQAAASDKFSTTPFSANSSSDGPGAGSSKVLSNSSIDPLQNDWREFECNAWHLEPTVRLISWAGSQIEPYGIDYVLQRLGFSHARTTIPKWLQRGCMDPLDKMLSLIVLKTIQLVKEERNRDESFTIESGKTLDKRRNR